MPSEIENAERIILHSLLLFPDMLGEIAAILVPEDFSVEINRRAYAAVLNAHQSNRPIEVDLIAREMGGDYTGNLGYLGLLDGGMHHIQSARAYARLVRANVEREHCAAALVTAARSLQMGVPIAEIASQAIEKLESIARVPEDGDRELLVSGVRFCSTQKESIQWRVQDLIPYGNGMIAGEPKAGKSWLADELALSLASGNPFMGHTVPRALRTALIAREDHAGLTSWRLNSLLRGRAWEPNANFFDENLWVNTRQQSDSFNVTNPAHRAEMIAGLIAHHIQFAIFDVLNILHLSDENDPSEMRRVMDCFTDIETKARCSIAVVHHLGKSEGKWTRRLRGASSIHGWVEWMIGVSEDEATRIRKLSFEMKASEAPEAIHYRIRSQQDEACFERCLPPDPEEQEIGRSSSRVRWHGWQSGKAS